MSYSRHNAPRAFLFEGLLGCHFFAGVLIPFYTEWGGIGLSEVLLINAAFSIFLALFEIPTGLIADKFGRKFALMGAGLCIGLAAFLYTLAPSFALFILAEIPWAFGIALASGADQALIFDSYKVDGRAEEARRAIAQTSAMGMLALAISAPLGSWMGAKWGLQAPVVAVMVPCALAVLVAFTMREPAIARDVAARLSPWGMLQKGLNLIKERREVRWLLAEQMTASVPCMLIIWTYQIRLKELNVPMVYFGWVHFGMCMAQVAMLAQPMWIERLAGGTRRYFVASALVPALAFLALGKFHTLALNVIAIVLIAGVGLSRQRFVSGHLQSYLPSDIRATAQSGVNMISRVLAFAAYPLIGWVAETSLSAVFIGMGLLMLLARLWVKAPDAAVSIQTGYS